MQEVPVNITNQSCEEPDEQAGHVGDYDKLMARRSRHGQITVNQSINLGCWSAGVLVLVCLFTGVLMLVMVLVCLSTGVLEPKTVGDIG